MGRNILFVTTDEQRCDGLGCYGGRIARTPVADRLAAEGVLYERAYAQNVTCMPARSTIVTGQHVNTHGVFRNGYSLPEADPSIAAMLKRQAGYRTALVGKAHWQPMVDSTPSANAGNAAITASIGVSTISRSRASATLSLRAPLTPWMADNTASKLRVLSTVGPKTAP